MFSRLPDSSPGTRGTPSPRHRGPLPFRIPIFLSLSLQFASPVCLPNDLLCFRWCRSVFSVCVMPLKFGPSYSASLSPQLTVCLSVLSLIGSGGSPHCVSLRVFTCFTEVKHLVFCGQLRKFAYFSSFLLCLFYLGFLRIRS